MIKRLILAAVLLVSPAAYGYAAEEVKPVVSVNGAAITEQQVTAQAGASAMTQYHKTLSEETRKKLRDEAIETLIDQELIYQAAVKEVTVSDAEIDQEFKESKKRFKTDEEFKAALDKAALSESALRADLKRRLMIRTMLDRAVTKPAAVTEDAAREYFGKNRARYHEPEKMKLREISIMVPANATAEERAEKKKKAEEVMQKIKAGGDFGLLAWDYSEDKYKYKSGELGYLHEGMLVPEVEKEVSKLKVKETTGILETLYGFNIFYLEEKLPARQLGFEDVREKLMKELREGREKKLRAAFLDELRKKAEIRRY